MHGLALIHVISGMQQQTNEIEMMMRKSTREQSQGRKQCNIKCFN